MSKEEKKVTGIDEVEAGFTAEPEMSPIEKIEADSFIVSEAEMEEELKEAGIEVIQAEKKEPVPIEETAIGEEEEGFLETPDISPIEQVELDSFVASEAEIEEDLAKAGISVPEKKPVKAPVEDAIAQEESFFNAEPELTPIEQLEADVPTAPQAEILEDMKKADLL